MPKRMFQEKSKPSGRSDDDLDENNLSDCEPDELDELAEEELLDFFLDPHDWLINDYEDQGGLNSNEVDPGFQQDILNFLSSLEIGASPQAALLTESFFDKKTGAILPAGTTDKDSLTYKQLFESWPCDPITGKRKASFQDSGIPYWQVVKRWPCDQKTGEKKASFQEPGTPYWQVLNRWPCDQKTGEKKASFQESGMPYSRVKRTWPCNPKTGKRLDRYTDKGIPFWQVRDRWPYDPDTGKKMDSFNDPGLPYSELLDRYWPHNPNTGKKMPNYQDPGITYSEVRTTFQYDPVTHKRRKTSAEAGISYSEVKAERKKNKPKETSKKYYNVLTGSETESNDGVSRDQRAQYIRTLVFAETKTVEYKPGNKGPKVKQEFLKGSQVPRGLRIDKWGDSTNYIFSKKLVFDILGARGLGNIDQETKKLKKTCTFFEDLPCDNNTLSAEEVEQAKTDESGLSL